MKDFHLTDNELVKLSEAHRNAKRTNANSAYKINAIILLGTGWRLKQVNQALLLDDETLRSYVEKYRQGGVTTLIATNYKGAQSQLDKKQINQLCNALEEHIYLTTCEVIKYVKDKFGIVYSLSGMRDLLHRLGYEYKKPKLVPGNPDIDAQKIFAKQYEDFILEKSDDIEILFIDAVHPEHNTLAACGWIKRGKKRELKTNSGRQRLNLHGAINAETYEVTMIESDMVNTDSTIQLLEIRVFRKNCGLILGQEASPSCEIALL